jgi:tetrahydromethanopterin S-methyltransferase subunit G
MAEGVDNINFPYAVEPNPPLLDPQVRDYASDAPGLPTGIPRHLQDVTNAVRETSRREFLRDHFALAMPAPGLLQAVSLDEIAQSKIREQKVISQYISSQNTDIVPPEGMPARAQVFLDQMNARFSQVNARFDQMQQNNDARFNQVNARFDQTQNDNEASFNQVHARFNQMQQDNDACFNQVNDRFNQVNGRFNQVNARFDQMQQDNDVHFNQVNDHFNQVTSNLDEVAAKMENQSHRSYNRKLLLNARTEGISFRPLCKEKSGFLPAPLPDQRHSQGRHTETPQVRTRCPADLFPANPLALGQMNKGEINKLALWFADDLGLLWRTRMWQSGATRLPTLLVAIEQLVKSDNAYYYWNTRFLLRSRLTIDFYTPLQPH